MDIRGRVPSRTIQAEGSEWRDPCRWIKVDGSELRDPSGGN